MLEQQGYVVQAVHTVESARQLCHDLHCDLVIVDSEEDYRAAVDYAKKSKPKIRT